MFKRAEDWRLETTVYLYLKTWWNIIIFSNVWNTSCRTWKYNNFSSEHNQIIMVNLWNCCWFLFQTLLAQFTRISIQKVLTIKNVHRKPIPTFKLLQDCFSAVMLPYTNANMGSKSNNVIRSKVKTFESSVLKQKVVFVYSQVLKYCWNIFFMLTLMVSVRRY